MINILFKNRSLYLELFQKYFNNKNKMPTGRWLREDKYNGSMSNTANKLSSYNNHDHCGGELCKYPPKI